MHGISQAQILEWVAVSSSDPEMVPVSLMSPALAGGLFTTSATWGILNKGCALFVYSQRAGEGSIKSAWSPVGSLSVSLPQCNKGHFSL